MVDEEIAKRTDYTIEEKSQREGKKLFFETFKHLTTLSTGAILILATFMKDVFKSPEWPFLVGVTFGLLILSTISSVIVMIMFGFSFHEFPQPSESITNIGTTGFIVSASGFILGVIALAVFAVKNF